ncbi:3-oxoadipate enol-lactonase [Corynebacterium nuruki]|uniref:3-oxoadipate enol-lactonase n=1 Tax=Corynebacterium nuruki TaxID=1032851 RepID=UPI0039BFC4D3
MTVLHHVSVGPRDGRADAPVIVLTGSIGSTIDMWLPQLDALSRSARVIAVDHRGHGGSPLPAGSATVADLARDLLDTVDALGVDTFHLAGLSLGGAIAQYLAAGADTRDRVLTLTLLCTAPKFGEPAGWTDRAALVRDRGTDAVADGTVEKWFSAGWREEHPASAGFFAAMVRGIADEGYAVCCEALAQWDFADSLGQIQAPTLTIAGSTDPSTPPRVLQSIADAVPGARAVVLDPGAHVPTIERPDEVTRLLADQVGVAAG